MAMPEEIPDHIHRVEDFDPESPEGQHAINMMIVALAVQKHGEETGEIRFGRPVKQLEVELPEDIPPESDVSMLEIQVEGRKARIRVVFFQDDREEKELETLKGAFQNVRNRKE